MHCTKNLDRVSNLGSYHLSAYPQNVALDYDVGKIIAGCLLVSVNIAKCGLAIVDAMRAPDSGEMMSIQVQAEIATLKAVLSSKVAQAATLRQNLGHTDHWRNGLRNLTESET